MVNISVMVSGGGTNLQAVIDGIRDGRIENARIGLVLSGNADAYALERAGKAGVKTAVVCKRDFPDAEVRADEILRVLNAAETDLVVMAGYINILHPRVCRAFAGRIINIHPALLPKHGGEGYFGIRVHEAVLLAGDRESGATVHFVDDKGVDSGEIILQGRVPVLVGDTPEELAARVLEEEHRILVDAVSQVVKGIETSNHWIPGINPGMTV